MSEYKTLFGKAVKALASDPTDAGAEGQIWYNSTSGAFKTVLNVGSWSSGGNLPTGRDYGTSGGTETAGFIAGGELGPGTAINTTFDYNGSSWSSSGNMGTTRLRMNLGVSGTQTAGLGVGGFTPPATIQSAVEEYDGSIWTAGTGLPVATQQSGGAGPQTSYMMLGTNPNRSEGLSYNGSTWAAEGSSSEGFAYGALAGQETAALAFYGATSPAGTNRSTGEEYNGTAWTTIVPSLPNQGNSGGAGGTISAAVFAGSGTTARYWNGTTVAATTSMANPRANYGSIGGSPGTFVAAGGNGNLSATEEFSFSIYSPIAATWASGGNLNTARDRAGNAGTKTAGLLMSGSIYPNVFKSEVEEYNGTTWSEQNNVATARRTVGAGTQTAGIIVGGTNGAPASTGVQTATEEYDGTNWASGGSLSTARTGILASGEQTTVYAAGGYSASDTILGIHEQYNGTSWTTSTAMNTDRMQGGSVGDTSSNIVFGGYTPPAFLYATSSEEWNGSSWTAGGSLNTARNALSSFGSQTSAVGAGGDAPGDSAATEIYDGSAWTTSTSMATAREALTPGSSYNSISNGMVAGGATAGSGQVAITEEFTPEIPALDYKTLTSS